MSSSSPTSERKLLLDGLLFAEAPRWFDGRLWIADMIGHQIISVGLDGSKTIVAEFDDETSGLGFLPDGSLIVVIRADKKLIRIADGVQRLYCDLSAIECESLNDMVVDRMGNAYVDAVVRRASPGTDDIGEAIALVDNKGRIQSVTTGLINPNGLAITPDERRLIVAETWLNRLTVFSISADGSLHDPAVFADLGDAPPDGICLDAQGAVWVGSPGAGKFMRVESGGRILQTVDVGGSWAVACVLGGEDRRTLFLLSADTSSATLRKPGGTVSRIETMTVNVPGAGWP